MTEGKGHNSDLSAWQGGADGREEKELCLLCGVGRKEGAEKLGAVVSPGEKLYATWTLKHCN